MILTKDELLEKLATDERWLHRGILAIYERQTTDEKQREETKHQNGIGFNGPDAKFMSKMAQQILLWQAGKWKYRFPMSPRQQAAARNRIRKYAGQLLRIVEEKQAA